MSITAFSTVNHLISLSQAADLTTAFRNNAESLLKPAYQGAVIIPFSETFNREAFDDLLAQEGCEGIRFYTGMDEASKLHLLAVAVNADNEDMLIVPPGSSLDNPVIIENGVRCPSDCPPASDLNT